MSSFGGLLFTAVGRNLQAKAQAGAQLNFTRIAIGDGDLGGTAVDDLTALKHQVKSLSITKLKTLAGGNAVVGTSFSNQDVVVGFYWKELGVFAQDPDLGEVLYCYGNAGASAEYIPPSGGADILEKSIDVVTIIGNATNVSATINVSLVFVTDQEFNDHAGDNVIHVLQTDRDTWNAKETPSGAQAKADAVQTNLTNHIGAADPHIGYVKHSLATALSDFLVASGPGLFVKKTLAEVKSILGLGTAAYTPSTAYATAAQGTLANNAIPSSLKGVANGVPTLGADTKIPVAQIPSLDYVPLNTVTGTISIIGTILGGSPIPYTTLSFPLPTGLKEINILFIGNLYMFRKASTKQIVINGDGAAMRSNGDVIAVDSSNYNYLGSYYTGVSDMYVSNDRLYIVAYRREGQPDVAASGTLKYEGRL